MFDKKVKMRVEEFKGMVKEIELKAKKEYEQKIQEFKIKYFTLKEGYQELEKKYIKVTQDNDVLKARLQELSKKQEDDTLNTLNRFSSLDKLLGDE